MQKQTSKTGADHDITTLLFNLVKASRLFFSIFGNYSPPTFVRYFELPNPTTTTSSREDLRVVGPRLTFGGPFHYSLGLTKKDHHTFCAFCFRFLLPTWFLSYHHNFMHAIKTKGDPIRNQRPLLDSTPPLYSWGSSLMNSIPNHTSTIPLNAH